MFDFGAVVVLIFILLAIGGIPIGYLVGMRVFGVDVTRMGKKGIGATNFERSLLEAGIDPRVAKRWRLVVEAGDQLKGLIPILVALYVVKFTSLGVLLLGVCLILGHCYSMFLGFKGGKGVATTMGVALGLCPWIAIPSYLYWYIHKKALFSHTEEATAIASIRAALLMGLAGVLLFQQDVMLWGMKISHHDQYLQLFFAFAALHIVFAHRSNLRHYRAEQLAKKRFPDDLPIGVFMTDPATGDAETVRKLLAQKVSFANRIPLWFFRSRLFTLVPFKYLKMGEVIVEDEKGRRARIYTWGWPWPQEQLRKSPKRALRSAVALSKYLRRRGAQKLCLGANTAIVGDKGVSIARAFDRTVVNGNKTTGGLAARVSLLAAKRMGWGEPSEITAAVIGAGGSVGQSACHILLKLGVKKLLIVGSSLGKLEQLAETLNTSYNGANCPEGPRVVEVDHRTAYRSCSVVIFATSSGELEIDPSDFLDGAVLTDMARPRNIGRKLSMFLRLLPNDGATVKIAKAEGRAGLGLPSNIYFPCWTELAVALLEGWEENSIAEPTLKGVEKALAGFDNCGFEVAGLRMFEQPLDWDEVDRRKYHADKIREGRQSR